LVTGTWGSVWIAHYASNGVGWVSNSIQQLANKVYLTEAIRNSVSAFYMNGVDYTTSSVPNTPPGALALSAAGASNEPMNGYIGEVIVFTRDLNTLERQDVESYLIEKWGIK
jgi:BRCT domain type II-containing protein